VRYFIFLINLLFLISLSACSLKSPPPVLDPQQIQIPAGTAHLGSDKNEKDLGYRLGGTAALKGRWFDSEKERNVSLGNYAMDQFLVTQEEYAGFVKETGHRVPYISEMDYQKQGFLVHSYQEVKKYLWEEGLPQKRLKNHPVVLVSVDDAQSYCQWKGKKHGRTYRLPTEDEWEKSARGTDHRYFPWGNQWDPSRLNMSEKGPYETTPVDHYPQGKSFYGLHDMAGNVFQWTQTPLHEQSDRYILKSCSWDDRAGICRSASRHSRLKSSRHILIGFRCASFLP
jgi:toxoflavin biosynthesis protein ToxD